MAAAGYGRRAAAPSPTGPTSSGICTVASGDYNPLFKSVELPSTSILAPNQRGGPRPLEWHVATGKAAGSAPASAADAAQRGAHSSRAPSAVPGIPQHQKREIAAAFSYNQSTLGAAALGAEATNSAGAVGIPGNSASATCTPAANKRIVLGNTAIDAPSHAPARLSAVFGAEVAGYTSVVTKNPVSPSGYAIVQAASEPSLPAPVIAASLSSTYNTSSRVAGNGYAPSLVAANSGTPYGNSGSSRSAASSSSSAAAAAAAAAALAALGGRRKLGSSQAPANAVAAAAEAPVYSNSCSRQPDCTFGDAASAEDIVRDRHNPWTAAAAGFGGIACTGPSALNWNVQEHPPGHNLQQPVAGRRIGNNPPTRVRPAAGSAVGAISGFGTAVELDLSAYNLDSSGGGYIPSSSSGSSRDAVQQKGYSPSSYNSGSKSTSSYTADAAPANGGFGVRPPSQQLSESLTKLKQLSSARLASRLTTPPGNSFSATDSAGTGSSISGSSSARKGDSCSGPNAELYVSGCNDTSSWRVPGDIIDQQQQQGHSNGNSYSTNSTYAPSTVVRSTSSRGRTAGRAATAAANGTAVGGAQQATTTNTGVVQRTLSRGRANAGFGPQSAAGGCSALWDGNYSSVAQPADASQYQQQGVALQPCANCGRRFNPSALEKHMKVCAKVFCEKRKIFNMQSQRLQGSEAAKFAANSSSGQRQQQRPGMARGCPGSVCSNSRQPQHRQQQFDNRPAVSAAAAKKSKWQQQSEQLRAAMRANQPGGRGSAAGLGGALPPEPIEDNRVCCPHCGRRFAELAAERHIPKCTEIRAKPTNLKAGGGRGAYMRSNSRR